MKNLFVHIGIQKAPKLKIKGIKHKRCLNETVSNIVAHCDLDTNNIIE